MPDLDFWTLLRNARNDPARESEWVLRELLANLDPTVVVEFQAALVAKANALVRQAATTWESAGLTIMRADAEHYDGVLSQRLSPPRAGMSEFEDLTDIAEEVLQLSIDVPEFGTSRSQQRDPAHVLPPGLLDNPLVRAESLSIPDWEQLPWRWSTWRVVTSVQGRVIEDIVFANRLWGESIGAATEKVLQRCLISDASSLVLVEYLDPHLSYPKKNMPPVFFFEFDGQGSAEEFRFARGYGPPSDA